MKTRLPKLAAVLALVIGLMAIIAGGPVLLGRDPGYTVIAWLPPYNFIQGLASVFLTSVWIWTGNRRAWPAARTTLGLHALVMLILLTAYRDVVAFESLTAMTIRIMVGW